MQQFPHPQQYSNQQHFSHLQNMSSTHSPLPHYVASSPLNPASHLSTPVASPASTASSTHSTNSSSAALLDYNSLGDNSTNNV